MSNDKNNRNTRNSGDWDTALEEWDQNPLIPALAEDQTPPVPGAKPPPVLPKPTGAEDASATVRPPETPGAGSLEPLGDEEEEDEERTVVGEIPHQLLADSVRGLGSASGLGQIFGRSTQPTLPFEDEPAELLEPSGDQALADVLLGGDPSLVTSAADVVRGVRTTGGSPDEPRRPSATRGAVRKIGEGDMLDPFADLREETPKPESESTPIPRSEPAPAKPTVTMSQQSSRLAARPAARPHREKTESSPPRSGQSGGATQGPKLLEPDDRKYSQEDVTEVFLSRSHAPEAMGAVVGMRATGDAEATPLPIGDDDEGKVPLVPSPERQPWSVPPAPPAGPEPRWTDERDAAAYLIDAGLRDAWERRASWLAEEAAARGSAGERSRMMLAVSELHAMLGDDEKASAIAVAARSESPSDPMLHRQARQTELRDRKWFEVLGALEAETRTAPTTEARLHGLLLQAELYARLQNDNENLNKHLDLAARCLPVDPRPHISKLIRELTGAGQKPGQTMTWPKAEELASLREAADMLRRIRAAGEAPAQPDQKVHVYDAIARARAALRVCDTEAAARALRALEDVRGMAAGATWLAASLAAQSPGPREQAMRWYEDLASGPHAAVAQRLLALRAVEGGAVGVLDKALKAPGAAAFSPADRVSLTALFGKQSSDADKAVDLMMENEDAAPLGAAALAVLEPPSAEPVTRRAASARVGNQASRAALGLARQLSAKLDEDTFAMLVSNLREARPDSVVARLLAVDCAIGFGTPEKLVDELAAWGGEVTVGEMERDRGLAAGLVAELLSMQERAREEYGRAHAADPTSEAALRSGCVFEPEGCSAKLGELAVTLGAGSRSAVLALEAALRAGPEAGDAYEAFVRQCAELDPSLPFASFLGERVARIRGDFDDVLGWVRARREAAEDRIEAAHDRCREAMLMIDRDPAFAASLLAEASAARPQDMALRSLYERFAQERPGDWVAWRVERAGDVEGPDRARLLLEAALAHERQGMIDDAAKMAQLAVEQGAGELAQRCHERCELAGAATSTLTDSLMQTARSDDVGVDERREARERLAELDEKGRKDQASALLWHRAILEELPTHLPSLRRIEDAFISEGRDEDLEPIAAELTRVLEGPEVDSHAVVAARVRLREQPWVGLRELCDRAASQRNPTLWAMRHAFNQARVANDDDALVLRATQLAERSDEDGEAATMLVHAAEALVRKGERQEAAELLQVALEREPRFTHAHLVLIDVLEASGEHLRAAEQLESLARKSTVRSHQAELWYRAARLWLAQADDPKRGRRALEEAADVDVVYGDVFDRLRTIYADAGEATQLAALLERRIEAIDDPQERVEMEVLRGKALAEVGEVSGAKLALAAALDASPDHVPALEAFAEVSWKDEDWADAEQALIRLGRLVPDVEQQVAIYRKLSEIYFDHLPDHERAELALREVLKRNPGDVDAQGRLVEVFRATGNAEKGIELCNALLEQAKTPEEKRKHTIQLALIHEQVQGDIPKAKGMLERVHKQAPTSATSLHALAEFYDRNGEDAQLKMLLDRAANDVRRALRTGRFNRDLFSVLQTVATLRSNEMMTAVARVAIAALEGENMELLPAVGASALSVNLDDLLAPELMSPSFRALLKRAGDVLDAAFPMDLQTLRAGSLPPSVGDLGESVLAVAELVGIPSLSVFMSPALGPTCVPVSSSPPVLVLGATLLSSTDDLVRDFLILRALKVIQTRGCVLSRTAPIDLLPVVAAFIKAFVPSYSPASVDKKRFDDAFARVSAVMPASVEPDVAALASDLSAGLDNRASMLNVAINGWGDRAALLAQGSLDSALKGVAWAGGHASGPPAKGRDRMTWIGRNAEARELIVFLASDEYGEARKRLNG